MTEATSFIKLGDASSAPVLSYSLPEATQYAGRHYVRLETPDDWLNEPDQSGPTVFFPSDGGVLGATVIDDLMVGSDMFVTLAGESLGETVSGGVFLEGARERLETRIENEIRSGMMPVVYENLAGVSELEFVKRPAKREGTIFLVETYQLSSYLGDYGAGKVLNTFSLLPGEKTKISIRSYTKSKSQMKQASSIFDSFSNESATAFEKSVKSEQSRKAEKQDAFAWHAEASASASFFGAASASVKAGAKGSSNSKRADMAKNVKNATSKHAAKASAKRDVRVNTSSQEELETGTEEALERVIENVNLSRTLNFVFRQMNQEFITLLSLTDIRIGWHDGASGSYDEASLAELDEFLEKYILPAKRSEAKSVILDEITHVIDHKGQWVRFVEERTTPPIGSANNGYTYHSVVDGKDTYQSHAGGLEIEVQGVIVSAQTNTLRTEGVIVEALLGQAEALDGYSLGLQQSAVDEKNAEVRALDMESEKYRALLDFLNQGEIDKARILADVLRPPIQIVDSD